MTPKQQKRIEQAIKILKSLGLPKSLINERSAVTLLALLDLKPTKTWRKSQSPLIGVTPIMEWAAKNYSRTDKPNTRETFRRQTLHQLEQAGIVLFNPDDPKRAVNSPKAVYQISPHAFDLLKRYNSKEWGAAFAKYQSEHISLAKQYASEREQLQIPIKTSNGKVVKISPGKHSELISRVIHDFASRYTPGSILIYFGDTGKKWLHFEEVLLGRLGVKVDSHGKMPDVILYYKKKNWLILVEVVTSHGPIDAKRKKELESLFVNSTAGLVFVTAFPDRSTMGKYLPVIAWETEVWVADASTHLIHFNGSKFLGPY